MSAPITYVANNRITEGTPTNQTITAGTGRVLAGASGWRAGQIQGLDNNYLSFAGMNIDDTADEYVLAYMPTSANQKIYGAITLKIY